MSPQSEKKTLEIIRIITRLSFQRGRLPLHKYQEGTGGHTTRDCQDGGRPAPNSTQRNGRTGVGEVRGKGGGWVRGTGYGNRRDVWYRARLSRGYTVDNGELGRDDVDNTVGVIHEGHVVVIASWNAVKVEV